MQERSRALTAFDAQFLAGETGNMLSHYCGVWVAGPDAHGESITAERLRRLVESRLDRVPALRWQLRTVPLGLEHPTFEEGELDVADHVHEHALPAGADDRDLADAIAGVMAERLDRGRPLWQFHVWTGLADGEVAIGMKFHHAAADALSAALMMFALLDAKADPGDGDQPVAPAPDPAPVRTRDVMYRAVTSVPKQPLRALRATTRALPHLDQVPSMRTIPGVGPAAKAARSIGRLAGGDQAEPPAMRAPRTRFNAPLSPGRSIAFGSVEVAVVRELKQAFGVTFNDVVIAAVAGGLRRRLEAGDELPAEPLLAFVPSNVRTQEAGRVENAISSFVVAIPTDLADPDARVGAAHAAMRQAKERHEHVPVTLLEDANAMVLPVAFGPLAAGMLRLMGSKLLDPPLNLTVSNVPGPPEQLFLDGAPLRRVSPFSLVFDGVTLNVTVISYAGRLEIGVVGDREAVPDAWAIVGDIEAEFAALQAAIPA